MSPPWSPLSLAPAAITHARYIEHFRPARAGPSARRGRQAEEPPPDAGALLERMPAMAECFAHESVQDVAAALRAHAGEPWADEAARALEKRAPPRRPVPFWVRVAPL